MFSNVPRAGGRLGGQDAYVRRHDRREVDLETGDEDLGVETAAEDDEA